MSNVRTSAGSTLAISSTKPATYNKAGFTALTWAVIGEITNYGEFGRSYNKVEHKPVGSRRVVKRKGNFDDGALPLEIGRDPIDAGQILLKAASDSDESYSYRLTLQDGSDYYFSAQAMDFKMNVGTGDNITAIKCTIEIDNDIIEDLPV